MQSRAYTEFYKTIFLFLLLGGSPTLAQPKEAAPVLSPRYSDAELVEILKNDGYAQVKQFKPHVIGIRVNGQTFILFNHKDGDLQLYYGVRGLKFSYQNINEWNRTRRLSRAYINEEHDVVLEADLLSNAGLTPRHVTEFLKVFTDSVQLFRQFLIENQEEEKPALPKQTKTRLKRMILLLR